MVLEAKEHMWLSGELTFYDSKTAHFRANTNIVFSMLNSNIADTCVVLVSKGHVTIEQSEIHGVKSDCKIVVDAYSMSLEKHALIDNCKIEISTRKHLTIENSTRITDCQEMKLKSWDICLEGAVTGIKSLEIACGLSFLQSGLVESECLRLVSPLILITNRTSDGEQEYIKGSDNAMDSVLKIQMGFKRKPQTKAQTTLDFSFFGSKTDVPDDKRLDHWEKVLYTYISPIPECLDDPSKMSQLVPAIKQLDKLMYDFSASNPLFADIKAFISEIQAKGYTKDTLRQLCNALTKGVKNYRKINSYTISSFTSKTAKLLREMLREMLLERCRRRFCRYDMLSDRKKIRRHMENIYNQNENNTTDILEEEVDKHHAFARVDTYMYLSESISLMIHGQILFSHELLEFVDKHPDINIVTVQNKHSARPKNVKPKTTGVPQDRKSRKLRHKVFWSRETQLLQKHQAQRSHDNTSIDSAKVYSEKSKRHKVQDRKQNQKKVVKKRKRKKKKNKVIRSRLINSDTEQVNKSFLERTKKTITNISKTVKSYITSKPKQRTGHIQEVYCRDSERGIQTKVSLFRTLENDQLSKYCKMMHNEKVFTQYSRKMGQGKTIENCFRRGLVANEIKIALDHEHFMRSSISPRAYKLAGSDDFEMLCNPDEQVYLEAVNVYNLEIMQDEFLIIALQSLVTKIGQLDTTIRGKSFEFKNNIEADESQNKSHVSLNDQENKKEESHEKTDEKQDVKKWSNRGKVTDTDTSEPDQSISSDKVLPGNDQISQEGESQNTTELGAVELEVQRHMNAIENKYNQHSTTKYHDNMFAKNPYTRYPAKHIKFAFPEDNISLGADSRHFCKIKALRNRIAFLGLQMRYVLRKPQLYAVLQHKKVANYKQPSSTYSKDTNSLDIEHISKHHHRCIHQLKRVMDEFLRHYFPVIGFKCLAEQYLTTSKPVSESISMSTLHSLKSIDLGVKLPLETITLKKKLVSINLFSLQIDNALFKRYLENFVFADNIGRLRIIQKS